MSESIGSAPQIDEAQTLGDDPIIRISPDELRRAIAVWLRVMPNHLWRPYEKMLAIDRKVRREGDTVDPRDILAEYVTGKFVQANWTATRERPPVMMDLTSQPGRSAGDDQSLGATMSPTQDKPGSFEAISALSR